MKKTFYNKYIFITAVIAISFPKAARSHEIYFCGEAVPTDRQFVASKLMNVIRNHVSVATLASLRYQAMRYFPFITQCLRMSGIPDDFKYVPVVECGFRNLVSRVGARGFWQIMPDVAEAQRLIMMPSLDQRDDPVASTYAAMRIIREHHNYLKKRLSTNSWILTAAAYNIGPGRLAETIRKQGGDYFNMQLNAETAEYVYRLIAVKELFEHPELYMKGFDQNIFGSNAAIVPKNDKGDIDVNKLERGTALNTDKNTEDADFTTIKLRVPKEGETLKLKTRSLYIAARLISDVRHIRDGQNLKFELLDELETSDYSRNKGDLVEGQAWIIDDRIFVDFGLGDELELDDKDWEHGLSLEDVKKEKDQYVVLRRQMEVDD